MNPRRKLKIYQKNGVCVRADFIKDGEVHCAVWDLWSIDPIFFCVRVSISTYRKEIRGARRLSKEEARAEMANERYIPEVMG